MAEDEPTFQTIELSARWVDTDEAPILPANQMLAQVNQGEVVLSFGLVTPPAVVGTPEQQQEELAVIADRGVLPVRTVARVFMTPERLREMVDVLNKALAGYDSHQRAESGETAETAE